MELNNILSKVGDLYFRRCVKTVLTFIEPNESDKILDAGCGEGFYEQIIPTIFNAHVTAVDNDENILSNAKIWNKSNSKTVFEKASITDLPYRDCSFDKVICTEVIEHIENDDKAIQELHRVLKPGGILALTVPNNNYPFCWDPLNKIRQSLNLGHFNPKNKYLGGVWSYDHKRLYTPNSIKILLQENGFEIIETKILTKYTLPFMILLLNVGKFIYTKLPVPKTIKSSMEKFEWDEENTKSFSISTILIDIPMKALLWIDSLNDKDFSETKSSVGIGIKAIKN